MKLPLYLLKVKIQDLTLILCLSPTFISACHQK